MKDSTLETFGNRTTGFRALIPTGLLCIVLSCASNGFGQYVNEYLDVSIGSDGTIYATGTTDAGWMSEHSAWVETVIHSPAGRYGTGSANVDSGGYVSVDASLPLDSSDLGEYDVSATGDGNCYVYGDLGEAWAGATLKLGAQQVQFYWDSLQDPQYGCYYANNCGEIPGTYCGPAFFTTGLNKGIPPYCYIYDSRRYAFIQIFGALYYWQLGGDYFSDTISTYPCDDPIP